MSNSMHLEKYWQTMIIFNNLYNTNQNYSGNIYNLETATRQGIIYPSLDHSIFELKFPKKDIKGKVTTY